MYNTTQLQKEINAVNVAHDMIDREIQKITNQPLEEEPLFHMMQVEKVFEILLKESDNGYLTSEFLPKLNIIRSIDEISPKIYRVVVVATAKNDEIEYYLTRCYVPF